MLVMHSVNLTNFENLSITIKASSYPAAVVGYNTTRSIITGSKGYSAGGSVYKNQPGI